MEINLKRTHKIVKELQELANKIDLQGKIELSAYAEFTEEQIENLIKDKQTEVNSNIALYSKINDTVYTIRNAINTANQKSGISVYLGSLESIKILAAKIAKFTKKEPVDVSIVARKLTAMTARLGSDSSRYDPDTIEVIVYPENLDVLAATLKRNKSDLEDSILTLNVTQTIDFPDDLITFLEDLQILQVSKPTE